MLRSHVDWVTSNVISGGAVATGRPDQHIDISIFVGGPKRGQLTCEQPREDPRGRDGPRDGQHVFRYDPNPPQTGPSSKTVTVGHVSTGQILGKGDGVLNTGSSAHPVDLGAELRPEYLHLPQPETPRQIDFTARSVRRLAYAALGPAAPSGDPMPPIWRTEIPRDVLNERPASLVLPIDLDPSLTERCSLSAAGGAA